MVQKRRLLCSKVSTKTMRAPATRGLQSHAQAVADVPYVGPVFGVSKTSISGFVAVGPHCIHIYIYTHTSACSFRWYVFHRDVISCFTLRPSKLPVFLETVISRKFLFLVGFVFLILSLCDSNCCFFYLFEAVFTEERVNNSSLPQLPPTKKPAKPAKTHREDSTVVELGVVAHNMWSFTPGSMAQPRAFRVDFVGKFLVPFLGRWLEMKAWGQSEW